MSMELDSLADGDAMWVLIIKRSLPDHYESMVTQGTTDPRSYRHALRSFLSITLQEHRLRLTTHGRVPRAQIGTVSSTESLSRVMGAQET